MCTATLCTLQGSQLEDSIPKPFVPNSNDRRAPFPWSHAEEYLTSKTSTQPVSLRVLFPRAKWHWWEGELEWDPDMA